MSFLPCTLHCSFLLLVLLTPGINSSELVFTHGNTYPGLLFHLQFQDHLQDLGSLFSHSKAHPRSIGAATVPASYFLPGGLRKQPKDLSSI
ncbi:hypothetical protein I79_005830 [Cricetulus griseus]|uniref:Uncharacterized protein n=1 Tax=Cricetulus griseus TaxID=10029 RepID=G3H676_CRIGR|nr:hypothetical protein I79_005830 [Cricetulus griseus]